MRVLIAPDSFKGSLSAQEAAYCIQQGWLRIFPEARCDLAPLADGGEGTVKALVQASGGSLHLAGAQDPLGRPLSAHWGLLYDSATVVVEVAAASGLALLNEAERDPRRGSSFGTGQVIKAALAVLHSTPLPPGVRPRLLIGLGGSATNDGGSGALSALGARFLDAHGSVLPPGGAALLDLHSVDISGLDPLLRHTDIVVACDVDTPLCGPNGASFMFGPQKSGAVLAQTEWAALDSALAHFAVVSATATGKNAESIMKTPGSGAAGGFAAGLLLFTEASLQPGIDIVLKAINFAQRAAQADLIITGEGRADKQSAHGKAPAGIGRAAQALGKPVICVCGALGPGAEALLQVGIDGLEAAVCEPCSLRDSLDNAASLLEAATARAARLLRLGGQMAR